MIEFISFFANATLDVLATMGVVQPGGATVNNFRIPLLNQGNNRWAGTVSLHMVIPTGATIIFSCGNTLPPCLHEALMTGHLVPQL